MNEARDNDSAGLAEKVFPKGRKRTPLTSDARKNVFKYAKYTAHFRRRRYAAIKKPVRLFFFPLLSTRRKRHPQTSCQNFLQRADFLSLRQTQHLPNSEKHSPAKIRQKRPTATLLKTLLNFLEVFFLLLSTLRTSASFAGSIDCNFQKSNQIISFRHCEFVNHANRMESSSISCFQATGSRVRLASILFHEPPISPAASDWVDWKDCVENLERSKKKGVMEVMKFNR